MANNKVYFAQPWGGLGDQLAYSNLPRLYAEKGSKFYVSYLNYSRNKEITDLVWRGNKFVENVSSFKLPNVGYIMFNKNQVVNNEYNAIQIINALHGFEPGNGFPDIYIDEQKYEKYKFLNVADLNAISLQHTQPRKYDLEYLDSLEEELNTSKFKILEFPKIYKKEESNNRRISINSLDSLIATLLSTENFHCLNSGSHTLAATLKHYFGYPKKIICYRADYDIDLEELGYWYSNVEYKYIPTVENNEFYYPRKIKYYQKILNFFL